jgi:hypothetical protein
LDRKKKDQAKPRGKNDGVAEDSFSIIVNNVFETTQRKTHTAFRTPRPCATRPAPSYLLDCFGLRPRNDGRSSIEHPASRIKDQSRRNRCRLFDFMSKL